MEWISQWGQHFSEGLAQLAHFHWLDWMVVAFIIGGLFDGVKKGFLRELFLLLETVLGVYVVMEFFPKIAHYLRETFPKQQVNIYDIVAFLLLTIAVFLIIHAIDKIVHKWFRTEIYKPVKLIGGAVLGALHFLVILSLMTQLVLQIPMTQMQRSFQPGRSLFGYQMPGIAATIHEQINTAVEWVQGMQK